MGLNLPLLNITAIVFSHDLASYWKSRKLCRIFFHLIRNIYSLGLHGEWYFYLTKMQLLLFISSKFKMSIHIWKIFWKLISEIDFDSFECKILMHGAKIYVAKFKIDFFKVNQSDYLKENKITLICFTFKILWRKMLNLTLSWERISNLKYSCIWRLRSVLSSFAYSSFYSLRSTVAVIRSNPYDKCFTFPSTFKLTRNCHYLPAWKGRQLQCADDNYYYNYNYYDDDNDRRWP